MDDLEITRLCARAAGLEIVMVNDSSCTIVRAAGEHGWHDYEPLADYQQALELVERLRLYVTPHSVQGESMWTAGLCDKPGHCTTSDPSILRAICLCAARVQQSKESQK